MAAWEREKATTDERIAAHATLDSIGPGNGYSLGWNCRSSSVSTPDTTVTPT
jgi:hypothetical protein